MVGTLLTRDDSTQSTSSTVTSPRSSSVAPRSVRCATPSPSRRPFVIHASGGSLRLQVRVDARGVGTSNVDEAPRHTRTPSVKSSDQLLTGEAALLKRNRGRDEGPAETVGREGQGELAHARPVGANLFVQRGEGTLVGLFDANGALRAQEKSLESLRGDLRELSRHDDVETVLTALYETARHDDAVGLEDERPRALLVDEGQILAQLTLEEGLRLGTSRLEHRPRQRVRRCVVPTRTHELLQYAPTW